MNGDRIRQIQYSSLIIGSKCIPPTVVQTNRRVNMIVQSKAFMRRIEAQSAKCTKNKRSHIRARNQRPDIFLEGEHVANAPLIIFRGQIDSKMIETCKEKFRKNMLSKKLEIQNGKTKTDIGNCCISAGHHKITSNIYYKYLNQGDQANTQANTHSDSSSNMRSYQKRRQSENAIDRYEGTPSNATNRMKVTSFARKANFKRNQTMLSQTKREKDKDKEREREREKEREKVELLESQTKKKQMFYVNQKDMVGIRADSFIVSQYPSGHCITGFYYRKSTEIASLTKIMTFYAILRLIVDYPNINIDILTLEIDTHASYMTGTSAQLYEGDIYTVRQLLYGMMLPSGNDAAVALAKWAGGIIIGEKQESGGNLKRFIAWMNKLAIEIGMKSSTFGNPHGLPHPQAASTAEDISLLICKCLQFPLFCQVIKTKLYRCVIENHGVKREVVWQNTNKLLRRQGFLGVKTGVTTTAGPCLATLYKCGNRTFVIVLLKTNKLSRRFKQTRIILSMVLRRLDAVLYRDQIKSILRNDPQLDSDNSQQENEFNFDRNDAGQMERRKKILINEL